MSDRLKSSVEEEVAMVSECLYRLERYVLRPNIEYLEKRGIDWGKESIDVLTEVSNHIAGIIKMIGGEQDAIEERLLTEDVFQECQD